MPSSSTYDLHFTSDSSHKQVRCFDRAAKSSVSRPVDLLTCEKNVLGHSLTLFKYFRC
jgi:hypothetical protein